MALESHEFDNELTPETKPCAREKTTMPGIVVAFAQHVAMRPEATTTTVMALKGPTLSAAAPGTIRLNRLAAFIIEIM